MSGCVMLDAEWEYCDKPAAWRPANIPMRPEEWFCREHAVLIAEREGVYGIYSRDRQDVVEEIPARPTPTDDRTRTDG